MEHDRTMIQSVDSPGIFRWRKTRQHSALYLAAFLKCWKTFNIRHQSNHEDIVPRMLGIGLWIDQICVDQSLPVEKRRPSAAYG